MALLQIVNEKPKVSANCFIANNAQVIGKVIIEEGASIWFNCILRGDVDKIIIGSYSNIQDGTIIHCDPGIPTIVGDYVTVGHGAILHGCTIKDKVLIGMGAIVMDEAIIGEGAIVAAGAVVTPGTNVAPNTLVAGTPAKPLKILSEGIQKERVIHALRYEKLWKEMYSKKES